MILMWLGPLAFTIISLFFIRLFLSRFFQALQKRFLNLPEQVSNFKMVLTAKLCAFSHGSLLQNQYSAVALLNSRSFSRRYAILLLCLSGVGLWTSMAGILLAWRIGGEIFFALGFLLFFFRRWKEKCMDFSFLLMSLGGFFSGMQWVLQKQGILMSILGESWLHFLLADGRFPAQLFWLTASFALTWIITIESWAVVLALVLFVTGSLSLNGAMAFILGEMLAHVWLLWWRSRKLNRDVQLNTKSYALFSTAAYVLAFVTIGFLRDLFVWSPGFDQNLLTEKSWQFFTLFFVIVAIQTLTAMIWGHFAAKKKIEEVQKGDYFSPRWISDELVSISISKFILARLSDRLNKLLAQRTEIDSKDCAQIPAFFLKEHENEIAKLALWLPLATEKCDKK